MDSKKRLVPKKLRFRIVVSIPLILTLFTLGSGLITLNLGMALYPEMPIFPQVIWTIIFLGIIACLSGIGIAYSIIHPLKKIATKIETTLIEGKEAREIRAPNEIEAMGVLFNRAIPSLDRLIKDRQILDNLPEGIMTLTRDGKVANLNKVFRESFGLEGSEAEGRHYTGVFSESPENRLFFSSVEKLLMGKSDREEGEFQICIGDRRGDFWVTARYIEKEGVVVIGFKDPLEIDRIRKEIKRTEQLALLGTLASGIAHEVRNPLGSFRGMTELIQEDLAPGDEKRVYTQTMLKEVDRLNHLVEDLLNFSRPSLSRTEMVNINAVVKEALSVSHYSFREKDIEILENYAHGLSPIRGDAERLTQVFLNLFTNAFEATPREGKIEVGSRKKTEIRSQKTEVRKRQKSEVGGQKSGKNRGQRSEVRDQGKTEVRDQKSEIRERQKSEVRGRKSDTSVDTEDLSPPTEVIVRISDTGCGMAPEELDKIFDFFYTTKKTGTGLGLPIARNIITAHGGRIDVKSRLGEGTCFEVHLPLER